MSSLERIFPGNSELAGRMRALDWSRTELGPPESWPERLRSAVSICLLSRFPIVMCWGPKMSMLYNDAYVSFLGRVKHPAMLGRSFAEAWAEVWPTLGPILEGVRKSGEASWSEDILMFFDRDLPKEEVYVTCSFSPLIGESNDVDGIFCICAETTEKLVGNRRSTQRALAAENAALRQLHEVSARLISEEALPTLLEAVVDAALAVTSARMGTVQLFDAATGSLQFVAQRGFDKTFLDYFGSLHAGQGARLQAQRLHERVIVEDVSGSAVFDPRAREALEAAGVRAAQSTPLLARDGRLLGRFSTSWTQPHRPDEATLRILDILARAAAALIEDRQREDALRSSEATVRELRAAEAAAADVEIRGYQERIQQMAFDAVVNEERERRRIAADLHDGVGQALALSQIKLTAARQEIIGSPREAIDQVIALIGDSIASTRSLTFELSPPILYDLGLKEALCWLAEKLEETYETRIEIADDEADKPLDDVTAGLVFRATRELLMNVVKHSRAPTAKVSLRRVGDRLAVTVEDTGVGFDPDDPKVRSLGFGLLGVREQIGRLRGSTEIISSPGQGARVAMSVPISTRAL